VAMDADELADAKRKLRDFASANGMQWVLDELDEAISQGIPEIITLRQSTQQGRLYYEDITKGPGTEPSSARRRRRAEEFVRRRPMTDFEQANLLIQALRRVLVDLDDVANESIETLNDPAEQVNQHSSDSFESTNAHRPAPPPITLISFAPDEGSTTPPIDTETLRNVERPARAGEILAQLEDELRS
jgi:hypothetical protein